MTHVRIERLAAGEHKENSADDRDRRDGVGRHDAHRLYRIEGLQYGRRVPDIDDPENRYGHEPDDHDWSEKPADARRSPALNCEQRNQDSERDRHDEAREGR